MKTAVVLLLLVAVIATSQLASGLPDDLQDNLRRAIRRVHSVRREFRTYLSEGKLEDLCEGEVADLSKEDNLRKVVGFGRGTFRDAASAVIDFLFKDLCEDRLAAHQ